MIKLLKYDWKRSSDGILSTLAILIILEAALTIVGISRNWDEPIVISLSACGYFMALVLLVIHCSRTFDHNLKSYSRMLLPLHPIKGIGASLLLSWACMIMVAIIIAIHLPLYLGYSNADIVQLNDVFNFEMGALLVIILSVFWTFTTLMLLILCSITVARSFRLKRSAWIGIIFFFAVQSLLVWLNSILFNKEGNLFAFISLSNTQGEPDQITFGSSLNADFLLGPYLLDLAFAIGYLALIIYLLKKKVDM